MSTGKQQWYQLLPDDLLANAYQSENGELAWHKEVAIRVIELLRTSGYVVTRVEIWLPTTPGPTIPMPFIYNWSLTRTARGDVPKQAKEFISLFEWDERDHDHQEMTPVFNIWAVRYSS
jgi:hypothetical protein